MRATSAGAWLQNNARKDFIMEGKFGFEPVVGIKTTDKKDGRKFVNIVISCGDFHIKFDPAYIDTLIADLQDNAQVALAKREEIRAERIRDVE